RSSRRPRPAGSISVTALHRRVHLRGGGGGRIHNRPRLGWPDHDLGERRVASPTTLFNPAAILYCRHRPRPFVLNEATDRHIRRESLTQPHPNPVSRVRFPLTPPDEC